MIAPARRPAALLTEFWQQAVQIRHEWLEVGLSTEPADRSTAEEALTEIYARHRRARPRFRWVDSPRAALPHLRGLPTHETLRSWITDRPPAGPPPLVSDIAAGLSHLRSVLDRAVQDPPRDGPPPKREKNDRWPVLPPDEALRARLPFLEILRQGVRNALFCSLAAGLYLPTRSALAPLSSPTDLPVARSSAALLPARSPVDRLPVGWYGNQDAAWVAYYDVLRRLGLAQYPGAFDRWVRLTRSCGWWWPGGEVCVVVERPAVIRVEAVSDSWYDEIRVRGDEGKPAVEYRDGWSV